MSEHTPGKLTLEEVVSDSGHIKHLCPVDRRGLSLLTVVQQEEVKFAAVYSDDDARRLVAAWNACEGLDTELLENIVMTGDTIKSRFDLRTKEERAMASDYDSLRAVNAELLRALEDAATSLETINRLAGKANYGVDDNGPIPTYMGHHDEVRGYAGSRAGVARAAITKARAMEGEKG